MQDGSPHGTKALLLAFSSSEFSVDTLSKETSSGSKTPVSFWEAMLKKSFAASAV
jgi:hypothetical protein